MDARQEGIADIPEQCPSVVCSVDIDHIRPLPPEKTVICGEVPDPSGNPFERGFIFPPAPKLENPDGDTRLTTQGIYQSALRDMDPPRPSGYDHPHLDIQSHAMSSA
jgi:hypothetical protein